MIPQSLRISAALALIAAGCVPMAGPPAGQPHTVSDSRGARPDAPVLVRKKNGRYRVAQPWTVHLDGRVWQVERGYTCNGITAPAKVKRQLGDGVDEPETWAAVFHDWLFTQPGMNRERADRLFYQLLTAYGVSPMKSRLMYSGVSAYSASRTLR